jgi:hypothetical protein
MSAKPNAPKKKAATSSRRAPANPKPKSAPKAGVYVEVGQVNVSIAEASAKNGAARGPFASVDDARSALLDGLLAIIETAEAQMIAVRRADTIEALRAATSRSTR